LPAGASRRVDSLALLDERSYGPVRNDDLDFHGTAVLAIAARIGTTRLIDNVVVQISPGGTALRTPQLSPGGTIPRTPQLSPGGTTPRTPREGTQRHAADD